MYILQPIGATGVTIDTHVVAFNEYSRCEKAAKTMAEGFAGRALSSGAVVAKVTKDPSLIYDKRGKFKEVAATFTLRIKEADGSRCHMKFHAKKMRVIG